MTPFELFAVAAPGLEPITAAELQRLELARRPAPALGGVAFHGNVESLYRANLHLRTASRVLVRLGEFYAAAFSELRKKAARLPWENYVVASRAVHLRVTCHKSKLYHSEGVAERVSGAIEDRLGQPVARAKGQAADEAGAAQVIVVRLDRDKCVISLDSSGALLHQRGYRLAAAKAPLRETLAAGMLLASGWDPASPLLDPFCGSGTIPIEAALIAQNIAPGRARRFAFMEWPGFDAGLWERLLAEAARDAVDGPLAPILGSDRDAGAIDAAQANAGRAGVEANVEFARRAVSSIEPPSAAGWIVTNPPYGVRVRGNKDLRNLYAQFGRVLRAKCPGWRLAMLSGSDWLAHSAGLDFDGGLPLVNGGLKVKLLQARVSPSPTDSQA